jgi:hypothetical protein
MGYGAIKVCTGTTDLTMYTPLFGDFNGDGLVGPEREGEVAFSRSAM